MSAIKGFISSLCHFLATRRLLYPPLTRQIPVCSSVNSWDYVFVFSSMDLSIYRELHADVLSSVYCRNFSLVVEMSLCKSASENENWLFTLHAIQEQKLHNVALMSNIAMVVVHIRFACCHRSPGMSSYISHKSGCQIYLRKKECRGRQTQLPGLIGRVAVVFSSVVDLSPHISISFQSMFRPFQIL